MRSLGVLLSLAVLCVLFLCPGCGDGDPLFMAPWWGPENEEEFPADTTVTLPPTALEPRYCKRGDEITVHGGGIVFPAGRYHVVFTGGASTDFELQSPVSDLKLRIPMEADSGPFGFSVALEPPADASRHDGAARVAWYRVEYPGISLEEAF